MNFQLNYERFLKCPEPSIEVVVTFGKRRLSGVVIATLWGTNLIFTRGIIQEKNEIRAPTFHDQGWICRVLVLGNHCQSCLYQLILSSGIDHAERLFFHQAPAIFYATLDNGKSPTSLIVHRCMPSAARNNCSLKGHSLVRFLVQGDSEDKKEQARPKEALASVPLLLPTHFYNSFVGLPFVGQPTEQASCWSRFEAAPTRIPSAQGSCAEPPRGRRLV